MTDEQLDSDLLMGFSPLDGLKREHRRRAGPVTGNIRGRRVIQGEGERGIGAKPTQNRLYQLGLQISAHVQKRRCARTAVQIFVGTAHGQVNIGPDGTVWILTASALHRYRGGELELLAERPGGAFPVVLGSLHVTALS